MKTNKKENGKRAKFVIIIILNVKIGFQRDHQQKDDYK